MGKVTIKDIAREAGVSITAVSLILNDKECRISLEKKALVKKIAATKQYIPNQAARSLATQKSNMLALILPDIENTFFSSLAKVIEDCCRRAGYALIITSSGDLFEDDMNLIRRIEMKGVDGIFLIASNESYQKRSELTKALNKLTIPYVMIDRTYAELNCDKIRFDNESGAYIAVKHLLEMGHKKIACVYRPDANGNGKSRLNGYLRAMNEYKCDVKEEYLKQGNYRYESGYRAAEMLIESDTTAAFICNDMMTLGFLKKLYEKDIKVPKDYAVVSYDDSLQKFLLEVELTSIAQNVERLGQKASSMLIDRLKGERKEFEEIVLSPELVIRDSVRKL